MTTIRYLHYNSGPIFHPVQIWFLILTLRIGNELPSKWITNHSEECQAVERLKFCIEDSALALHHFQVCHISPKLNWLSIIIDSSDILFLLRRLGGLENLQKIQILIWLLFVILTIREVNIKMKKETCRKQNQNFFHCFERNGLIVNVKYHIEKNSISIIIDTDSYW